jgi:hypothetical protein
LFSEFPFIILHNKTAELTIIQLYRWCFYTVNIFLNFATYINQIQFVTYLINWQSILAVLRFLFRRYPFRISTWFSTFLTGVISEPIFISSGPIWHYKLYGLNSIIKYPQIYHFTYIRENFLEFMEANQMLIIDFCTHNCALPSMHTFLLLLNVDAKKARNWHFELKSICEKKLQTF